jgi:ABC-type uncharacterized transport system involved in gliding motility auxiliary subunit
MSKGLLKNRRFRHGTMAITITVCFIAFILLFNVALGLLSERYALQLDLTKNNIYFISDKTKEFLDGIGKDVQIYVLTRESDLSERNIYFSQANRY